NVTLTDVTLVDDKGTADTSDDTTIVTGLTLAAGASVVEALTVTLTQDQVDDGFVTNIATATGTPPQEGDPVQGSDSDTVTFSTTASVTLEKTNDPIVDSNSDSVQDAGDTVTYHYVISNAGNATLTDVTLVDDHGTPGDTTDDQTIVTGLT